MYLKTLCDFVVASTPEWKRVEPLCWLTEPINEGEGERKRKRSSLTPPSPHPVKTTWVPNYWNKMQLQGRLAELCKVKSIVEKKNYEIHLKCKACILKVTSFLSFRCILREMTSVFIQALSGTWNSFCDFDFFFLNKMVLMRKTFPWHAVIHVRTKGHPISNLADFEKELAKRTRVNFEPRDDRKLRWLSHPYFETAKLERYVTLLLAMHRYSCV